jgi:hypothetical protein
MGQPGTGAGQGQKKNPGRGFLLPGHDPRKKIPEEVSLFRDLVG